MKIIKSKFPFNPDYLTEVAAFKAAEVNMPTNVIVDPNRKLCSFGNTKNFIITFGHIRNLRGMFAVDWESINFVKINRNMVKLSDLDLIKCKYFVFINKQEFSQLGGIDSCTNGENLIKQGSIRPLPHVIDVNNLDITFKMAICNCSDGYDFNFFSNKLGI